MGDPKGPPFLCNHVMTGLTDILVIICLVIIVRKYNIVNFGYKIVSYKIPIIFLYIRFFPL